MRTYRRIERGTGGGAAVRGTGSSRVAFTIIEIMLAIGIFSMVLTAIYASWSAILRSAKVGGDAATAIQRSRIASRTLEDGISCAVLFSANAPLYTFDTDTSGDYAYLSFVARLPPSFPGSGFFGDQVVRRLTFSVEKGKDGVNQLVLSQSPLLQTNTTDSADTQIILAREVSLFALEFWDAKLSDWNNEWIQTNQLPVMVRFALSFGQLGNAAKQKDITMRVVRIASAAVAADFQTPRPGGPGAVPPGTQPGVLPGSVPPGSYGPGSGGITPPGIQPGVIRNQ